jgi:toxin ParE1/3/4
MKIVWTRLALSDLDKAYNYIAANNPSAAVDTINRIEKAVNALVQYPEIGRPGRIPGTKELVVTRTPFILPYRVEDKHLKILAVIHTARQWPESF